MKNFLMGAAVVLLIGAAFCFGIYYKDWQEQKSKTPAAISPTVEAVISPSSSPLISSVITVSSAPTTGNTYYDAYFDFTVTYPNS